MMRGRKRAKWHMVGIEVKTQSSYYYVEVKDDENIQVKEYWRCVEAAPAATPASGGAGGHGGAGSAGEGAAGGEAAGGEAAGGEGGGAAAPTSSDAASGGAIAPAA